MSDSSIPQLVVCAAIRRKDTGEIIVSARHYDPIMRAIINRDSAERYNLWFTAEQGFIDNHGKFLTREEARVIATAQGQIRRRCGGDEFRLFSENLY